MRYLERRCDYMYDITVKACEVQKILAGTDSGDAINGIAQLLAEAKLTPIQAQAVLVRAWGLVVGQCVLGYPSRNIQNG